MKQAVSDTLIQSIQYAIYDRDRSWYSRYFTSGDPNDEEAIHTRISNIPQWPEILRDGIAQRKTVRAPNGKYYQLTSLPFECFCIRYHIIKEMAAYAPFLWHSRCDSDFLNTQNAKSLFLGSTRENSLSFNTWACSRREKYVLIFDVESFYPSINHGILIEMLHSYGKAILPDERLEDWGQLLGIAAKMLSLRFIEPESAIKRVCVMERGLPIGNTTERFLANLYLSPLDEYLMTITSIASSRRIDDIRVYSDDQRKLYDIKADLEFLLRTLDLRSNIAKVRIISRASL